MFKSLSISRSLLTLTTTAALAAGLACASETPIDEMVDPADPIALSNALSIQGATRLPGPFPQMDDVGPVVSAPSENITSSNGSTALVPIEIISDSVYTNCFAQVVGANDYFEIPSFGGQRGELITLPLELPQNVLDGQFCILVAIQDSEGNISEPVESCIEVVALGTGVLQVSLSWNTDNTDIDLHVIDPNDEEIYFANSNSESGGFLDRDDTNGYGPENVYFIDTLDGDYAIDVNYYGGAGPTEYTVTITGLDFRQTLSGTLEKVGDRHQVALVRKSGDFLDLLPLD